MRREGQADVGDGGEGGDDERDGGGDTFFLTGGGIVPDRAHAHAVFADRDGDAERGTEFHADGLDGGVEIGAVAGDRGGGHPVGGEIHFAEVADLRGGQIGEGFADGEAGGSRGVVDGDGCAFAHRHGLARVNVEGGGGDGAVGDGDLPRTDHLVAGDEAAEGAVADGDEERFVGYSRVREHTADGFGESGAFGCDLKLSVES